MRGNSFGKLFTLTSFGESHGPALGAIIDGVPAGLSFNFEELKSQLLERSPGKIVGTSTRQENDTPEILSGIFQGKTTGHPIAVIVRNTDQNIQDYSKLKDRERPGHADRTTIQKFGIRDYRGGGRSSGRETLSRVIAGYFATLIIPTVKVYSYIIRLGDIHLAKNFSFKIQDVRGPYHFPDPSQDEKIKNYLLSLKDSGDSVGGIIGVKIQNCPPGLGEPCFDKLKADFAKAYLSIGACVSFSMGIGDDLIDHPGKITSQNHHMFGGIEGGMSNGLEINLQIGLKATSTIGSDAKAGRHDPCILPRVIPVVSAMTNIVLADHFLRQNAYQL